MLNSNAPIFDDNDIFDIYSQIEKNATALKEFYYTSYLKDETSYIYQITKDDRSSLILEAFNIYHPNQIDAYFNLTELTEEKIASFIDQGLLTYGLNSNDQKYIYWYSAWLISTLETINLKLVKLKKNEATEYIRQFKKIIEYIEIYFLYNLSDIRLIVKAYANFRLLKELNINGDGKLWFELYEKFNAADLYLASEVGRTKQNKFFDPSIFFDIIEIIKSYMYTEMCSMINSICNSLHEGFSPNVINPFIVEEVSMLNNFFIFWGNSRVYTPVLNEETLLIYGDSLKNHVDNESIFSILNNSLSDLNQVDRLILTPYFKITTTDESFQLNINNIKEMSLDQIESLAFILKNIRNFQFREAVYGKMTGMHERLQERDKIIKELYKKMSNKYKMAESFKVINKFLIDLGHGSLSTERLKKIIYRK